MVQIVQFQFFSYIKKRRSIDTDFIRNVTIYFLNIDGAIIYLIN